MAKFLPSHYKRVLDIGCGEGFFSKNLKPDSEIWGIEPVKTTAKKASKNIGKVLNGLYEDVYAELPDNYFDLIICNDVIEHFKDHDAFFESIKQKMNNNSYIIGAIPNVRYAKNLYNILFNKDWRYEDSGILDRTHLRFFTEKSLQRTFAKHDFIIDEFYGINSLVSESFSYKEKIKKLLLLIVIFSSFGYYKDIQYLQFGFRLKYS